MKTDLDTTMAGLVDQARAGNHIYYVSSCWAEVRLRLEELETLLRRRARLGDRIYRANGCERFQHESGGYIRFAVRGSAIRSYTPDLVVIAADDARWCETDLEVMKLAGTKVILL